MTLFETLGSLFIALIVFTGSAYMISKAIDNDKISRAQQNLSTFRLDIKNLYAGASDFTGLTTDVAVKNEIVPDNMLKSNGDVRNVWNGAVTVAAGATPTTFTITHNEVPKYACAKLATFQVGSWVSISVNGFEISQASGMLRAISDRLGDTNTIIFTSN
ncbi:type 4 pilus major pilin [Maridesulfovibrio hydrothermalis]|uniref:PilS domain protein n=1 Tax=Maridesulfovibrio hydrothermalis AM13 = DSM 14728 TaxID=1121451 RepID=L0RCT4_9BACT|nr:type 4 pilus major pilin [Maridesulfovibrio hydrothermalis]CCO24027.1 PilS domain protein [Maridesulfovibrio hydrothermalis AM13 = DSM 14728]